MGRKREAGIGLYGVDIRFPAEGKRGRHLDDFSAGLCTPARIIFPNTSIPKGGIMFSNSHKGTM